MSPPTLPRVRADARRATTGRSTVPRKAKVGLSTVPRRTTVRLSTVPRRAKVGRGTAAEEILGAEDASLLDIVDNLLNKGVVLNGDVTIALAQVDLVYARLSLLLSAADRVLPGEDTNFLERQHARHQLRLKRRGSPA
jgi:hypothetical protein